MALRVFRFTSYNVRPFVKESIAFDRRWFWRSMVNVTQSDRRNWKQATLRTDVTPSRHGANWPRASVFARSSAPLRQKGNDGAWRSGFIWIPYSSYLRVTMRQSHSSLLNSPTSGSCDMLRRLTKCVEYVIQCTVSAVLVTIIGPKTRSVIETQRGLHGSLMDIPSAVHLSDLGSTLGSISHPPSGINIQHSAQPAAYHFRMECMLPSYIEHTQLKLKSETFYALHLGSTLYLTLNCRHEYVCKCMYACMFVCI